MNKYQTGDISDKTHLQKQGDGSWKPVGKEKEKKQEDSKEDQGKTNYQDFGDKDKFFHELYASSYDDVINSLSEVEHIALDNYRDNDYLAINSGLRGSSVNDKEKSQVQQISNAIKKSTLKHDIVLKRGVGSKGKTQEFFKSLQPGEVYSDKGFVSTSLSDAVKEKFKDDKQNGYSIEILAKKGKNALSMQNLGSKSTQQMYNDEFEFLLDKDSRFKVISNENNELKVELL